MYPNMSLIFQTNVKKSKLKYVNKKRRKMQGSILLDVPVKENKWVTISKQDKNRDVSNET